MDSCGVIFSRDGQEYECRLQSGHSSNFPFWGAARNHYDIIRGMWWGLDYPVGRLTSGPQETENPADSLETELRRQAHEDSDAVKYLWIGDRDGEYIQIDGWVNLSKLLEYLPED